MALTPLHSSIGRGLNPQPSDCEPSALLLNHGFRHHPKELRKSTGAGWQFTKLLKQIR